VRATDGVVDGVVPLHQVDREQPVPPPRRFDQGVGLCDRHRQRLLANDVLARFERRQTLRMVQERRSRDIDHVDVVSLEQLLDALDVGNPEPLGCGVCGGPVRSRHADQLHARDLRELLQSVEPESTATDHRQSNVIFLHRALLFPAIPPEPSSFSTGIRYNTLCGLPVASCHRAAPGAAARVGAI
jgi:hypothetical protein